MTQEPGPGAGPSSAYFSAQAAVGRQGEGRYTGVDEQVAIQAAAGVVLRPIPGDRLMFSHVTLAPWSEASVHSHDEEQMGFIVSGSCEFELGGVRRTLRAGDVYWAPPGVPHGARTRSEPCVILDAFAPPRAALRELLAQREAAAPPARAGALALATEDDVATALRVLTPGERVVVAGPFAEPRSVIAVEAIPAGHKIALAARAAGAEIRKNGHVIGIASAAIVPGTHVHTHNLRSRRGGRG